jgi:hypothetical protein
VVQPLAFSTRFVDAGNFCKPCNGRTGRRTSSPEQFGHRPFSFVFRHVSQNVHSNEQMNAVGDSGGRSLSQHSQLGRSSSIFEISRSHEDRHEPFETSLVDFIKASQLRAVEIQNAAHAPVLDERHDKL